MKSTTTFIVETDLSTIITFMSQHI